VSFLSAFVALAVSCAVGIIFGITPAKNAARRDPVDALRHE
jgi:ABC-type antimicrobial peptide transport system permease subunit